MIPVGLSKWFYLGFGGIILGVFLIYLGRREIKSKFMENGYLLLIMGIIGVFAEFTDFATILFCFTLLSLLIIIYNKLFFCKKRIDGSLQTHYVYYAKEFFPVVLVVWILRAFLFEMYQIPSSSMRPDLIVGDFVLVNKFNYGIREPFTNKILIPVHQVKRGDVMVFKAPYLKNIDFIKRVIGLPNDHIIYRDKKLIINDQPITYTSNGNYIYSDTSPQGVINFTTNAQIEDLLGVNHDIITMKEMPPVIVEMVRDFPQRKQCHYDDDGSGFDCIIPQGMYFMMGDNRDNSDDSRYWGFVPEINVLGQAERIIINFSDLKNRIWQKII